MGNFLSFLEEKISPGINLEYLDIQPGEGTIGRYPFWLLHR